MEASPKRPRFEEPTVEEESHSEQDEHENNVNEVDSDETHIKNLDEVDTCQSQIDKLQEALAKEIVDLEFSYVLQKHEIYERRRAAIKKIPNFWKLVAPHHPEIGYLFEFHSGDVLEYLYDIFVDLQEKDGFKIIMTFRENPFFYEENLIKEYKMVVEDLGHIPNMASNISKNRELIITPATVTWKEGHELFLGPKPFETLLGWLQTDTDTDMRIAECIRHELFTNPMLYYFLKDYDSNDERSEQNNDTQEVDDVIIVESDDDDDNAILTVNDSDLSDHGENQDDDTRN